MPSIPLRVSRRASTVISYFLSLLLLPVLVLLALFMPHIADAYLRVAPNFSGPIPPSLWTAIYLALAIAVIADGALLVLLRRVRREAVFSAPSVDCLRILSYACFGETLCFAFVGFFFPFSFAVSFAACFIGMAMRVVKNVIEEAAAIKAENDFTI